VHNVNRTGLNGAGDGCHREKTAFFDSSGTQPHATFDEERRLYGTN
jgi:hypothetical protein